MESQEIFSLLNKTSNFKFVTRKSNIVNNQSNANYSVRSDII